MFVHTFFNQLFTLILIKKQKQMNKTRLVQLGPKNGLTILDSQFPIWLLDAVSKILGSIFVVFLSSSQLTYHTVYHLTHRIHQPTPKLQIRIFTKLEQDLQVQFLYSFLIVFIVKKHLFIDSKLVNSGFVVLELVIGSGEHDI